jgi:hypothetical protein
MHAFNKSTNEVQDSFVQFRRPPALAPLFAAFMIHFLASTVPSLSELCDSETSSGGGISCIAARNSDASDSAIEKAKEVSGEMLENELDELGRSCADEFLGRETLWPKGAV